MGLVNVDRDGLVFDGGLADEACARFESALDALRKSHVQTPTVDLSNVSYISSKAVGLLVALWIDMADEGSWFRLVASDRVWDVLGKAGVDGVFFKRPPEGAEAR